MDETLLRRFGDVRVPRYTSYPTAPHFNAEVGEAEYRQWLQTLAPGESLSLYLHVPFCPSLCWYCGCTTKAPKQRAPVDRYVDVLAREIALVADALPARLAVDHVHWGGGTPTILTEAQIERLMGLLRARFDVAPAAEIAIEIDPRTLTGEIAETLGRAGFNRASLGVQSFDPRVQAAVNRVQSAEQTLQAATWLREAGIDRINVDLLYGLPHETAASAAATAERVLALAPSRLAVFGYAHVPAAKPHQRHIVEADLPGVAARADQAAAIDAVLTGAGYQPIGIDHYALPEDELATAAREGTLRRNFQGYTTDQAAELIGFGASAIGRLTQGHVQNSSALSAYEGALAAGRLPIVRGRALTAEDRLRGEIIERLMSFLEVDIGAVAERHGQSADFPDERAQLEDLARQGLVELTGDRLAVPLHLRSLARIVAATFDAYLLPTETRHAVAV